MADSNHFVIEVENVKYRWPQQAHDILDIDNFVVEAGEHLFIQGASGSGKSTLLNLLAGVLNPQQGKIKLLGKELTCLSNGQKDRLRADHLGIVFQQFNLLPYLSAIDNIQLALNVSTQRRQREKRLGKPAERIIELLSKLGIEKPIMTSPAAQLSIGQQQRVAVARALIGRPEILIADEPTSALDSDNRDRFLTQLFQAAEQAGTTIVFVSHDRTLESHFSRSIHLAEINQAPKLECL